MADAMRLPPARSTPAEDNHDRPHAAVARPGADQYEPPGEDREVNLAELTQRLDGGDRGDGAGAATDRGTSRTSAPSSTARTSRQPAVGDPYVPSAEVPAGHTGSSTVR
jgi:hypothetical protein